MEFKAEQKHLLLSPRKMRPVADVVRKMTPEKAVITLPFIKKRSSEYLLKVLKSAIANASQKGVDVKDLIFKEIQIGEGPRLRRGQPVSRGRWHPIKKRMSHVKVILSTIEVKKKMEKKVENTEVKENKKEVKAVKTVETKKEVKSVKKTNAKGGKK